ncbi:MAG: beta-galactosidase [Methylacidiphilales bacterium]|nr:beta-galactosidase [Candidatus Methylacidiphilales bacterium]
MKTARAVAIRFSLGLEEVVALLVCGMKTKLLLIVALAAFIPGEMTRADDAPDPSVIPSPFGIGSDYHRNNEVSSNKTWVPQMAEIGLKKTRTPNSGWEVVEPEEGKWTWDTLDAQIDYYQSQGFVMGGILIGCPKWNTKDQGLPVNNIPGWSEYVTQTVKHANGRIKYWEIWNEPPNFIARDQTAADYAKIVASAYDAAKAADPTCMVGIATKSVHVNFLEQAIKAGAKDHFDYITLHPYEVLGISTKFPGAESIYMHIASTVRKMLAAQDPAKVNVPIIFTELGSDASQGEDVPANALVKAFTMGIAQGITCIDWFEGRDGDSGPMGLLRGDGTKRPAYTAMAQMIQHLGEQPIYLGWVLFHDKDYGFVFQGAKGPVMVAWSPKGTNDNVDFGQNVSITDPLTGTETQAKTWLLTNDPVLLDDVPANLVAQAKGNKSKPFPWDGDYTDAKSVSVTYGKTNVEKGLHTQSAANIASDLVLYGGAARAGDVPGGNVFMVDPNFLSYSQTPIEVTVVVRRNAANDNAGFKLNYESTTGYKNLGWYTVPDNKEWHTMTWKITDAEFVSMWGYNFSLDSDGNQYNKYDIQSVTVTKLPAD